MLLTDLQQTILKQKGFDLKDKEKLEKYLAPDWDRDLFNSNKIKNISKAIKRIKKAIDKNEKIVIYADYDCDGIPGAVILHDFFEKLNYQNLEIYIPHRHREGFGLNKEAIKKIAKANTKLIITVDLGIANFEEAKLVKDLEIDLIITDHHLPLEENGKQILPDSYTIINTKLSDDKYEEKFLCGASTAWKLVNAFLNKYRKDFNIADGWEKWLLDMVGIATIADMIPLQNENRLLARYGLEVLKKSKRPGLQKILAEAKIQQRNINEGDVSFSIAPRINSASRMSEPMIAFKALLNNSESLNFVLELEKLNEQRKLELKKANQSINIENLKTQSITLIGNEAWTPGILGLIASNLVEKTSKTTFVWGLGEEKNIYKGSVRVGKDNINIVQLMDKAKNILKNYGGHKEAGGFSLEKKYLMKFKRFLDSYQASDLSSEELNIQKEENILEEKYINLKTLDINKQFYKDLQIFAPFGIANEKITFKLNLNTEEQIQFKKFGKNEEHLEMLINNKLRAVEFFIDEYRFQKIKNQKEFLINIDWDNFRNDVLIKFLK